MQAVTAFRTERPKDQRIHVVARDPDTGKSKCVTLYGITPDDFVAKIRGEESDDRTSAAPALA